MRELLKPSLLVPALILAEVCIPFSVTAAPTLPWVGKHPDVTLAIQVLLYFVLAAYVIFEGVRHTSLLTGAVVGLWAATTGLWPSLIVGAGRKAEMDLWFPRGPGWAGLLSVVPDLLKTAALGLAAGLLVSLIPWLIHRREAPKTEPSEPHTPASPLLVKTVFGFVPLLAALGVTRRLDWILQLYSSGQTWSRAAQKLVNVDVCIRLAVLALAAVGAYLFFMRKTAARAVTLILLVLSVIVVAFRLASMSRIPLAGTAGWPQLQSGLDIADIAATLLAAGIGIPYFLRSRSLRAVVQRPN
jgi:hypothetical protein